ncbi:MAG: glycosyltransferase, partial [Rhizobiales bacterium]|nr:glycosyltransferase [Hyphomicrobiales bacterium]
GVFPVIWNVRQSLDDPSSMSFSTRFAVRICRALSTMPAGVIYNSKRALGQHSEFGYRNRNAVVIPNGFFMPEPKKIVAKSPRVFGIAGRFHPQKDYDTFFKAAAIALSARPDARFRAAGHGLDPHNAAVASLVKSAGLAPDAVDLCGEISGMDRFYESIDILALSSRTEGFPNVIAEAMSHGKPVVTTDVGDAAAIVGPAGFVVPPTDPRALAGAMIKAMDLPPEEYEAMCRQARARTEASYGIDRIARQFEDFVRSQPG